MHREYLCLKILPLALLFSALSVQATPLIVNGSFENVGGAKASFSINNPTPLPGWTATPSGNKILDCLMFSTDTTNRCGTAFGGGFTFWTDPGPSPDGGNFVGMDGYANFNSALVQTVTGLKTGASYTLSFWQAAAQQSGFDGPTTEKWSVTFGGTTKTSTVMNNVTHGKVAWNQQALTFTANATSQVLSFLAIGTPTGLPPFVLLDGVALVENVPEPATLVLMGLGLGCLPLLKMSRKQR